MKKIDGLLRMEEQFNSVQSEAQFIHKPQHSNLTEQYSHILATYTQTRIFAAYAKELAKFLLVAHTVMAYLLLSSQPYSSIVRSTVELVYQNQVVYRLIEVINYFINFANILLIGLLYSESVSSPTKTTIAGLLSKHLPLLVEFMLPCSAFLVVINSAENVVSLASSIFLYFYCNIQLTNETNRTAINYITSSYHNLYFCAIVTGYYLVNCIAPIIVSPGIYEIFIIGLGICLLLWFQITGYRLYFNTNFQRSMDLFITFMLVFAIQLISQRATDTLIFSPENACGALLTFIIVGLTILNYSETRFMRSFHNFEQNFKDTDKLKQFQLLLWSYQKQSAEDIEKRCFLKGIAFESDEFVKDCEDLYGYISTKHSLFKNNDNEGTTMKKSFDQILVNYIQKRYEQHLQLEMSKEVIIDYIDFILNSSGNFYRLHFLLEKVKLFDLGLLQRIKITKVALFLKNNVEKFNNQLYDHLDLDEIMYCEDVFHDIIENVEVVVEKNIEIWKKIQLKSINQTEIEANLKTIHETIETIDEQWIQLNKFLKIHKKWLFIYLVYRLYIKNEKIKADLLAEINEDSSFNEKETISEHQIFNQNTFYLRCRMTDQELRIIKVSTNAENLIEFSERELVNNQLNILLPEEVREDHNQMVVKWLERGECNHDKTYRTIYSYFVDRNESKIPTKIIFTLHIDYVSEYHFQFVALLNIQMKAAGEDEEEEEEEIFDEIDPQQSLMRIDNRDEVVLDNKNNIFLKEKNLRPVKSHPEISFIKIVLTTLVGALLLIILIFGVSTYNQFGALKGDVISYFNFLNLYRYPMSIGKNYMKYFLGLGNQTKVINQISLAYSQIVAFSQDPFTLKTIFNSNINNHASFEPYLNNSYNQGLPLNQNDVFYQIMSCLASLSKLPININRNGYEFVQFNMYLKPAFDTMINGTKYNLNKQLGDILQNIMNNQYYFGAFQIFCIIIVSLVIIITIYRFLWHMQEVMKIVFQLEDGRIKINNRYWVKFKDFFKKINVQSQNYQRSMKKARKTEFITRKQEKIENQNLNKREKNITVSKQQKKQIIIFFSVTTILFIVILFFNLAIEIYTTNHINSLNKFYEAGFYFLRFYPVTSTLGHAVTQKYYSTLYPKEVVFYPERFQDTIDALFMMGNTSYIGQIIDETSPYYLKQKYYLFSNPCSFDPTVLVSAQVSMASCLAYNNKSFTTGIITYIRNIQTNVSNYLHGKINMSYSQLDELTSSLSLVTYYITDAIKTWSFEFVDRITALATKILIIASVAASITVFLYILLLIVVKNTLESAYNGVVHMLSYMMPESVLLNEKITRQQLVTLKILKD